MKKIKPLLLLFLFLVVLVNNDVVFNDSVSLPIANDVIGITEGVAL